MSIYRGIGGPGDATSDASVNLVSGLAQQTAADRALAQTSEATAAARAAEAVISAAAAAISATASASSATTAGNSLTATQAAQTAAELALDSFDDIWLGAKSSNPAYDNDGDVLVAGAAYFNTTTNKLNVYSGGAWVILQDGITSLSQDTNPVLGGALDLNGFDVPVSTSQQAALDAIVITQAALTKTFTSGEEASMTLSSAVSTPVISVTKEVPQTGVTDNSWDVSTTNMVFEDFATAVTITPSATTGNITLTLGSGSFTAAMLGMEISGNGGVCVLTATDGSATTTTDFTNTNAIASGSWEMYGLIAKATGIECSGVVTGTPFGVISSASLEGSFGTNGIEPQPSGTAFNTDGTKMYIVGLFYGKVLQLTLSTAFDVLGTVTYDGAFSVSAQETSPESVIFNTDGTKMYVIGTSTDTVYQYTLTTAFDVTGTVTLNGSYSVQSQEGAPKDISFNTDGTKMYIIGYQGRDVNQYTLSTAFDVTGTVTFNGAFSVASQELEPRGLTFNTDGTKMYVSGNNGDDITQYTLSTAFDVLGTVTHNGQYSLLTNNYSSQGVTFNTDGTKMYVADSGIAGVYVYTLTTGFDVLGTVSYSGLYSTTGQEHTPKGVAISSDGTKIYIIGDTAPDSFYQYTLTTPNDVTGTVTYNGSYSFASQENEPSNIAFSADGTKVYLLGVTSDQVFQYTLTTAWDITGTVTYNGAFSVAAQESSPGSMAFNADGTRMYIGGVQGQDITQYTLTTAFNVLGTVTHNGQYSVASQLTQPRGLVFNTDGTKMFVLGENVLSVHQYTLTTGFNVLGTVAYDGEYNVAAEDTGVEGLAFSTDGSRMYTVGRMKDSIYQYSLSSAFNVVGSAAYSGVYSVASEHAGDASGMTFNADGTKMYVVGPEDDEVNQYTLSTAFDVTGTVTLDGFYNNAPQEGGVTGITFNPTGTKMYLIGVNGDDVNQYTLTTAFDVTGTVTHNGVYSVAGQDIYPTDVTFNTDGTKMFVMGDSGNDVNQYTLTTAFDILGTVTFNGTYSVGGVPTGLAFSADGTKMFVTGSTLKRVLQYTLTTAFDITGTVTLNGAFSTSGQAGDPNDVTFNTAGDTMYVVGSTNIYQYSFTELLFVSAQNLPAITKQSTNTTYWVDINSMSATETKNGQTINYAVSTDDRTTWLVNKTSAGVRSIVRNNAGTWEKNTNATYGSTTWASATTNTEFQALSEAMDVAANTMTKAQLEAVGDAEQFTLANDLDLAIILKTATSTATPISDGVSVNYDANIKNEVAIAGTDYSWDAPTTTAVTFKSLAANNLKIRIV